MEGPEHITEEHLLDHLFEQCDRAVARRITAALETDPGLRAKYHRLADALKPLEAWTVPEPPQRMVERILDGIAAQNPPKLVPAASTLLPTTGRESVRRPLLSLRELVALAACITIFVGVFVPTMSRARFNSRRQMCANNLGLIHRGLTSYATANAGMLPFTGQPTGQPFLTHSGQSRTPNRNHLYPMVKQGNVPRANLRVFLCPGRKGGEAMSPEQVDASDGFPDPRNCSYDVQHTCRPVRAVVRFSRPLPLLGDANPLFEDGRFHRDVDPEKANSMSHRGLGQNLLLPNGAVIWQTTPIFEPTGDNIWQVGQVRVYTGSEVPTCTTDTFLVP